MTEDDHTTEQLSFTDIINSLTGYEETEIENRFGAPIADLLENITRAGRALIFIVEKRATGKSEASYKTAMSLKLSEVNDRFKSEDEDADDVFPNEPDTDQGKDASLVG